MQREAAERFMGVPKMTMLSTQLAPWFDVTIVHRFRRTDFRPAPAVDSVLVHMHLRSTPLVPWSDRQRFTSLVAATFSAWKPTVATAMTDLLTPATNRRLHHSVGNVFQVRPSHLALPDWIELFDLLRQCATETDWDRIARAAEHLERQQATISRPTQTPSKKGSARRPKW